MLALFVQDPAAVNTVYNVAFGEQTSLNLLVQTLKKFLSESDPAISEIPVIYGTRREGDIPHSLASIEKARKNLGYSPRYDFTEGLRVSVQWYMEHKDADKSSVSR